MGQYGGLSELVAERDEVVNGLTVDVAHVYSALVVEQDLVALPLVVDAEVELVGLSVRPEGFDEEVIQHATHSLHSHLLPSSSLHPVDHIRPLRVQQYQPALPSSLDELVGLHYERQLEQPGMLLRQLGQYTGRTHLSELIQAHTCTAQHSHGQH